MIHSFLLIGQSNMAGRGYLNEALPVNSDRIRTLRNGRWHPMFRPINPDRSFSGVNLAESFGECISQKYDTDVGLICCADGGTSLEQWQPGSLLLDHAIAQARLAMRTSVLCGVLWHQGEADCSRERYPFYRERFESILNSIRYELGNSELPFLLGGLGDFLKYCELDEKLVNYPHVNAALKEIAERNINVAFVPADGLGANPDNLHFNASSLHEFGKRYFEAYEKLTLRHIQGSPSAASRDTDLSMMEKL